MRVLTRLRTIVGVLLAVGLAAGCAAIPSSGPVHSGPTVDDDVDDSRISAVVAPPRPGASREAIVDGFLLASGERGVGHESAKGYLTTAKAQEWRPDRVVRIYRADGPGNPTRKGSQITATFTQVARIDADGRFAWLAEPVKVSTSFSLAQEGGQWRIADLEDGLILSLYDVGQLYQQMSVYFLEPDKKRLVPDLVMVPRGNSQATAVVTRLLRGPTKWLDPAVTTAFPTGTTLTVASVPVVDGVAQVDLDSAAASASAIDRQAMAAQLVWTLKALPEVGYVRITADQGALEVPGADALEPVDSWPDFDPGVLSSSGVVLYAVRDGRVGILDRGSFTPVPGAAGSGKPVLGSPAVSVNGDRVAGLSPDRRTLLAGPLGKDKALQPLLQRAELAAPSWDRADNLWTVDLRRGAGTPVVVPRTGKPRAIGVDDVGPGRVTALRVARDGARVLLIVRRPNDEDELLVGVVVRDGDGLLPARIENLVSVAPTLVQVLDAAWSDGETLAVLGRTADEPVVRARTMSSDGYTGPNGYADQLLGRLPGLVSLAAAPGEPVVAGTSEGQLFASSGGSGSAWSSLGAGTAPTYPG